MRIPILNAILIIILSVLIDIYIFTDIRRTPGRKSRDVWSWIYGVFTVCCWILLVVFLAWPKRDPGVSILTPMWLLFIFISIYIPKFIYTIVSLLGRLFFRNRQSRRNLNLGCGLPLASLLFILMWIGVLSTRHNIEIKDVEVYSTRLPESFDGMKVLQFSDLHLGSWGNDTTFISALVDSINSRNADIVVFTGDFVNRTADEMTPFLPVLRRVKAPMGVYAVYGNHDYGGYVDWPDKQAYKKNLADLRAGIESLGWTLLCNQSTVIRNEKDSIAMIGVENWGEPPFNQIGDLVKAYPSSESTGQSLNDNTYKILLTHNPNHWDEVVTKESNVDLSLAGHTHAMQMALGSGKGQWSPAIWKYKQWGGLYERPAADGTPMNLYVNIGAGEVGFPARIGTARPEINVITLRSGSREVETPDD